MKGTKTLLVLIMLFITIILLMGCNGAGNNGEGAYAISFTMDGTNYSFTKGYDDINGLPEGSYDGDLADPDTFFAAVPEDATNNTDSYVIINVFGGEEGSYEEKSTDSPGNVMVYVKINGEVVSENDDGGDLFSLEITQEAEAIGDAYVGTFEGTVSTDDSPKSTYEITNGYFKVERIADGSLGFPF